MILRIDSCGECPAKTGEFHGNDGWSEYDCAIIEGVHTVITKEKGTIPLSCPLREREVKGGFLPDIEDLSHTIDFEEPKCGKCGGTGIDSEGYSPGHVEMLPCDCPEVDGGLFREKGAR